MFTEYEAEGYRAFQSGADRKNPYEDGTKQARDWHQGWRLASDESEAAEPEPVTDGRPGDELAQFAALAASASD